jgi:hypothetical protein
VFQPGLGVITTAGAGAGNPTLVWSDSNCHHKSELPNETEPCPVLMEVLVRPGAQPIVGVAVALGVAVDVGVAVAVGVRVGVAVVVKVGVAVAVEVAVLVGVIVAVAVGVGVPLGVEVGDGLHFPALPALKMLWTSEALTAA